MDDMMKEVFAEEIDFVNGWIAYPDYELEPLTTLDEAQMQIDGMKLADDYPDRLFDPEVMMLVWNYCIELANGKKVNTMTPAQERIAMMKKTISAEEAKARECSIRHEEKRQMLIAKILGMSDRIASLIEVGNSCAEAGMMPYKDMYHNERTKDNFCTDGIYHEVGFWHDGPHFQGPKYSIRYVGFENGGACGHYDFYTDGKEIFEEHEHARGALWDREHHGEAKRRQPTLEHLQYFVDNFDAFEKMFYAWFDKRFGKEV